MTPPLAAGQRPFQPGLTLRRRRLVAAGLIVSALSHGGVLAALWPAGSSPEVSGGTVVSVDLVSVDGEEASVDPPPEADAPPQPIVQADSSPPLLADAPEPVDARPPQTPDAPPVPPTESPETPVTSPPPPSPVVTEAKSEAGTRERRVSPPSSAPRGARKPKAGSGPALSPAAKSEASVPVASSAPQETMAATFTPPVELDRPKPVYPPSARRRGLEGKAVLRVSVDAEGKPVAFELIDSSGFAILDDAAIEAAKKRHFRPATRLGVPVAAPIVIPTLFNLEDE